MDADEAIPYGYRGRMGSSGGRYGLVRPGSLIAVDEDEEVGPGGSRSPAGPAAEAEEDEPAAPPPPPGAPAGAVADEDDDAVGLAEPRGSGGS